jgi:methylenetetrahydrofolate reductase (NADPH)
VFPAAGVEARLFALPAGASVAVTCSERHGIGATLDLTERLARAGFHVVPHLSARQVRDREELQALLTRLSGLDVRELFVPGGDRTPPAGPFDSALALLEAMAEIDHGIGTIGVAAYPEGHPLIGPDELFGHLEAKLRHADYAVTQMCFDAGAIRAWLTDARTRGIDLPVRIGLPGVIERKRLVGTAVRIGVGPSVSFLRRQKGLAARLLAASGYRPDDLLTALAPTIADPTLGVEGLHLYTLNQVEATEEWRAGWEERLQAR